MNSSTVSLLGCLRLTKRGRFRAATAKAITATKKLLRKIFRRKAKKARMSFLMPYEYATLHRSDSWRTVSSKRSRRSAVTVPNIFVVHPTTRQAKDLRFSIHQVPHLPAVGKGQVSPHIRFTHPAVDAVIPTPSPPSTRPPSRRSSIKSSGSWETVEDDFSATTVEHSPTASDFAGQVRPEVIHCNSLVVNGGVTFEQTLAVVDGTRTWYDVGTLPSEARFVRAKIIEIPKSNAPATATPQSIKKRLGASSDENHEEARKAVERVQTLKTLDGRTSQIIPASAGVKPRAIRPYTDPGLPYVAYRPPFDPYNDPVQQASLANASTVEAIESLQSGSNKSKDAAYPRVQRVTEKDKIARDAHKLFYDRIESGTVTPIHPQPPLPVTPIPARRFAHPPIEPKTKRKAVLQTKEPKQLSHLKPLPPSPRTNSLRRLTPPARYLNDNGYPNLSGSAAAHSVKQHYQRRSLFPDEAKRMRRDAKKAAKKEAKKQRVARQKNEGIQRGLQRLMLKSRNLGDECEINGCMDTRPRY